MKLELRYGAIIGVLIILWVLFEFWLATTLNRPDLGEITGFLASLIPIIGITLGLRAKKREQKGILTHKEAIVTGLKIAAIVGLISAIFIFIYMSFRPDAFESYYQYLRDTLPESGLSAEEIESQITQFKSLATPMVQSLYFFVSSIISGLIISAIVGFFVKTKKKLPAA